MKLLDRLLFFVTALPNFYVPFLVANATSGANRTFIPEALGPLLPLGRLQQVPGDVTPLLPQTFAFSHRRLPYHYYLSIILPPFVANTTRASDVLPTNSSPL